MSADENRALLRRWSEAIGAGKTDVLRDLIAADYCGHQVGFPGTVDREQQVQFAAGFLGAFPDASLTVDDLIVEGNLGVVRWTFSGTHQGELMGMPPTGRPVTMTGIEINRIAGGKIVEHWVEMDLMGMMTQLGAIPTPG